MSDLHHVGVSGLESFEAVGPSFVREALERARERTWKAFESIRAELKEGMTEPEARALSIELLADLGAKKHWHRPYVRFGPGTAMSFHDPIQTEYHLQDGDPVYIDLGPVWTDDATLLEYEGDVGDTFVIGDNATAERCAKAAREIFQDACARWRSQSLTGERLYAFLKQEAVQQGYQLIDRVDGHRLGDYPHTKHSKERLAKVPFHPSTSLWVLEVQIIDPQKRFGAFYEDLLQ